MWLSRPGHHPPPHSGHCHLGAQSLPSPQPPVTSWRSPAQTRLHDCDRQVHLRHRRLSATRGIWPPLWSKGGWTGRARSSNTRSLARREGGLSLRVGKAVGQSPGCLPGLSALRGSSHPSQQRGCLGEPAALSWLGLGRPCALSKCSKHQEHPLPSNPAGRAAPWRVTTLMTCLPMSTQAGPHSLSPPTWPGLRA